MYDVAHSYVWHDSFICAWHDSFICMTWLIVTWLIHMYDVAWLIHMYDVVWHDSFICMTWLIHMCDMTHFEVRHDSFLMWGITHSYVWTRAPTTTLHIRAHNIHTHIHTPNHLCTVSSTSVYIIDAKHAQEFGHNTLQHTATHTPKQSRTVLSMFMYVIYAECAQEIEPSTLQHTATHRNTPQHTTTHHNTPQHTHHSNFAQSRARSRLCNTPQHTAGVLLCVVPKFLSIFCIHCTTHCNTLQHTATHCNTLQHTATHCNTLQHTHQKNFAQSWARPWHLLRSAHSRPTAPAPAPRVARAACPHTCTRVTRMLHICNTHTTSGACGLATYLYMCYTYVTHMLHVYYLYVTRRSAPAPLVARAACPHICICGTHMLQVRYTYITHM